jgi:ribosome-associated toxin RatA of RatAB toxin-antitoxin module
VVPPIERSVTIAAPVDKVAGVISQFEEYPNWQKEVEAVEVLERDDQGRPVSVRMRTAAMGMKASYVSKVTYTPESIHMQLVEGDMMTANDTKYQLRGNDSGGTELELLMSLELKWNLPEFMLKQITNKAVNDLLASVRRLSEAA